MTDQISTHGLDEEHLEELAYRGHTCTVSVLASALAHQLSQPLTASLVNIDAVLRLIGDSRPEVSEALRDVAAGHERLASILRDFRKHGRALSGPRESLDVNAVVEGVAGMVQRQVARLGVRLRLSLASPTKAIDGNRVEIQQLVLHLLTNACEAVEPCEDVRREVSVSTRLDGAQIVVAVADRGIGMTESDFGRLYEPFFSTKDHRPGLGLAAALQIARSHGGALRADRNPNGGMTFTASLPTSLVPNDVGAVSADRLP